MEQRNFDEVIAAVHSGNELISDVYFRALRQRSNQRLAEPVIHPADPVVGAIYLVGFVGNIFASNPKRSLGQLLSGVEAILPLLPNNNGEQSQQTDYVVALLLFPYAHLPNARRVMSAKAYLMATMLQEATVALSSEKLSLLLERDSGAISILAAYILIELRAIVEGNPTWSSGKWVHMADKVARQLHSLVDLQFPKSVLQTAYRELNLPALA